MPSKIIFFAMTFFSFMVFAIDPQKVSYSQGQKMIKENRCNIHLSFGSYGSGTPIVVEKKIKSYLKELTTIKNFYSWNWGLEGEYDFCLDLVESADEEAIFKDLKKIIPAYSKKGFTVLKSREGQEWRTSWPKKK